MTVVLKVVATPFGSFCERFKLSYHYLHIGRLHRRYAKFLLLMVIITFKSATGTTTIMRTQVIERRAFPWIYGYAFVTAKMQVNSCCAISELVFN